MSTAIDFAYHFAPVGQGLFSYGSLRNRDDDSLEFVWVYDCGTTSSRQLLEREINRFDQHLGRERRTIDLLTLSHFDRDHISGVCELIRRFRIKTLMLPYVSLEQRMIIAISAGADESDDLFSFCVYPQEFLSTIDGPGIERILYVQGGADGATPPIPEGGNPSPPEIMRDPFLISFRPDKAPKEFYDEGLQSGAEQGTGYPAVEFLAKGATIVVNGLWEFVPYNDDPVQPISTEFTSAVEGLRDRLITVDDAMGRVQVLSELKSVYDRTFGQTSETRNAISLFLYSGPVYATWRTTAIREYLPWATHPRWPYPFFRARAFKKCSQVYTGDGYLDTPERFDRLFRFLSANRMNRIGAFQVMHHGAESNSHDGLAAKVDPLISVFSSDPDHQQFQHPHAAVLRDFWSHFPFQVNKTDGLLLRGLLN